MRYLIAVACGAVTGCGAETLPDYDLPPEPPDRASTADFAFEPEAFDCFSEQVETDFGVVGGTIYSGYDASDPTLVLYRVADTNDNGIPEFVERYERDGQGQVLRFERERQGARVETSTYDARGNLLTLTVDAGADGVDWVEAYTYDDGDRMLTWTIDLGGDGTVDQRVVITYTEAGAYRTWDVDDDGDGEFDREYDYTVDDQDRVVLLEGDLDGDGEPNLVIRYTWTHPTRQTGTIEIDDDNDGEIDERWEVETDDGGRQLYQGTDLDADGVWDEEVWTTYDDGGRRLTRRLERAIGAIFQNQLETRTYDPLGRELSLHYETTHDDELIVDLRFDTTYGGTCP